MTAEKIAYAGYDQAVLIENADTRVILCPECGGRVLSYAHRGVEGVYLNPEHDGYVWDGDTTPRSWGNASGGRCDIGPELAIPQRPETWVGAWEAAFGGALGERSARLTSQVAPGPGARLVRDFALDEAGSHLTFTQTQINVSDGETRWCHWGRTYGHGHGICVVPLTPALSHLPNKYVQYRFRPEPSLLFRPDDPCVQVRDGYLVAYDTLKEPKLGIDSFAGWFAYLMTNDLMLVKRYPVHPNRSYTEIAGFTVALFYRTDGLYTELEPIGPMEVLQPGESASFTEEWWLVPYPFPADRANVDLVAVEAAAMAAMG